MTIYIACVHGSTNGIPISFKVLPMVPLVIPLVQMVMQMVPLALPMVPLVNQWYHWLPMVPLVKLPTVPLGVPRTEPLLALYFPNGEGLNPVGSCPLLMQADSTLILASGTFFRRDAFPLPLIQKCRLSFSVGKMGT